MGDTEISWTHRPGTRGRTWNPVQGCSRISEGCRSCYAERLAARFAENGWSQGLINLKTRKWNGTLRLAAHKLADPLRWRDPSTVFTNSMSDLFHESLTNEQIAAVFGVMAAAPQHTFQVLTKRATRMREWFEMQASFPAPEKAVRYEARKMLGDDYVKVAKVASADVWPLPNVWLGVSVENQDAADERIPELLKTPAAVRFLSCEPLLSAVNLKLFDGGALLPRHRLLHWIIAGCESGPGARPCDVAWLRSLRDQCAAAGAAFFLKQAEELTLGVCGDADNPNGDRPCRKPITAYVHSPNTASYSCGCCAEGPEDGACVPIGPGDGSRRKAGGVIELPYLDGVQHAAFPEVRHA